MLKKLFLFFPYYFQQISLQILSVFSSMYLRTKFILWRISFGKNLTAWGNVHISIKPYSIVTIGDNCRFRSNVKSNLIGLNRKCSISTHSKDAKISIGNYCGFSGSIIASAESITIGNYVGCGGNTTITDFDWHVMSHDKGKGLPSYGKSAPIIIEDGVWLGLNVVVLKGVTIGEKSVIAANSVVTKSIPPNSLAGGNPCKVIKSFV